VADPEDLPDTPVYDAADRHTMSFGDHLEDLRKRVVFALVGVIPIFAAALFFGKELLGVMIRPVQSQLKAAGQPANMQVVGPLETFTAYLHISFVATVLVGSPWILWNLWKFVAPGLYRHEKRFVYFLLPMSGLLTIVSALFLYFAIIPAMLSFFINWGSDIGLQHAHAVVLPEGVAPPSVPIFAGDPDKPVPGWMWINQELNQLRIAVGGGGDRPPEVFGVPLSKGAGVSQHYRISEYMSLFLSLALAFAVAFQMPVVVLLLGWVGIIDRAFLARFRKHAIMVCAVAGALLTPGDPLSMLMMAVPLYGLYELGGWLLKVFPSDRIAGKRDPRAA
jgi:sec-independent protein translocase protein TatC